MIKKTRKNPFVTKMPSFEDEIMSRCRPDAEPDADPDSDPHLDLDPDADPDADPVPGYISRCPCNKTRSRCNKYDARNRSGGSFHDYSLPCSD